MQVVIYVDQITQDFLKGRFRGSLSSCLASKQYFYLRWMSLKWISQGIPWWSSGNDSALLWHRAQDFSLVRELRSHKLYNVANE